LITVVVTGVAAATAVARGSGGATGLGEDGERKVDEVCRWCGRTSPSAPDTSTDDYCVHTVILMTALGGGAVFAFLCNRPLRDPRAQSKTLQQVLKRLLVPIILT
jgi:hypothetical protein